MEVWRSGGSRRLQVSGASRLTVSGLLMEVELGFGRAGVEPAGLLPRVSGWHRSSLPLEPGFSWRTNNKIGVIKHRPYGFHSFAALAAMAFLCCTDLQLNLPFEVEERHTLQIACLELEYSEE